ncbi:MAG: pyruvate dehydrogenase (acetyl-transferring) E1 component subunit alpha [Anaerolineales bacterium]|nr:pyruvate dehydrogenase (acetyl-transferring) E1 component subunit alpha [Anaerolineales bacterium]
MNKKEHLELYRQMVMIRRMEERAAELYQQGKIGGFLHLYIGQEAVSTGIVAAKNPQDRVITAYRDHGVAVNVGIPVKQIIAELLGKATGISKGKGGSMHMADVQKNFWGGHAIVGAHLPIAAGMALGDQYQGNDSVTIAMFGDGASNIGYFHEALNLSKVWKLPVLWVVENNRYGMGTSVERASAVSEIRQKAEGYCIPNQCIEGMDLISVYEAVSKALDWIRTEGGPFLLEIETYRFVGHSMGDPERYREASEVECWQEGDPIGNYYQYLIEEKIASAKALNKLEEEVMQELEEAVEFAENSPEPAPEELFKNIYVEE